MKPPRLSYEWRVPLLSLLSALPALVVALVLIWMADFSTRVSWSLTVGVVGGCVGFWVALRERLIRPLQTMSNMIAALQEGDYTMQARLGRPDDSLGLVAHEVNQLGRTLRDQRLEVLEATALLRRVMAEIGVAVFAFDHEDRLVLGNRAAETLLDRTAESMTGRRAEALGLHELLHGDVRLVADLAFPGAASRWEVRVSQFRQEGRPHRLLVISDLSRVLREEERSAWQRIVRVLGHEINNSLTPIRSIAQSLHATATDRARAADEGVEEDDFVQGLDVIASRAEALSRFLSSYARLARLPSPTLEPLSVDGWIQQIVSLEKRVTVELDTGPDVEVLADRGQLDQLLINLIDNAVDASQETGGKVRVGWGRVRGHVEIRIEDEGPGLADTANLFVPFFTTKEHGSGIGLVLCREIAEAHRGSLTLRNRTEGPGCIARFRIPLASEPASEAIA